MPEDTTIVIKTEKDKLASVGQILKWGVIATAFGGVVYVGYKIWQFFNPPPPDWSSIWEGNVVKYQHSFMGITTDCLYLDEFLDDIKGVPAENKFLIMCHAIVLDSETPTFLGNVIYVLEHQDDLVLTNYDLSIEQEWDWSEIYINNVKQYKTICALGITKYFDFLELFKVYIHSLKDLAITTTICYAVLENDTEIELGNAEYVIRRENELVETIYVLPDPIPDIQGIIYYQADFLTDIRKFYFRQEFIDFLELLSPDIRFYWNCHAFDINGVDTYLGNGLQTLHLHYEGQLPLTILDIQEPEPIPEPECYEKCERWLPISHYIYEQCLEDCARMGVGSIMITEPSLEEPPPIATTEPESIIIYEPSPPEPPPVIITEPDDYVRREMEFL